MAGGPEPRSAGAVRAMKVAEAQGCSWPRATRLAGIGTAVVFAWLLTLGGEGGLLVAPLLLGVAGAYLIRLPRAPAITDIRVSVIGWLVLIGATLFATIQLARLFLRG